MQLTTVRFGEALKPAFIYVDRIRLFFESCSTRNQTCSDTQLRRNLRDLIIDGVPTVESLNLSGCFNLTDVTLGHALTQELPSLTMLNLSLCKQITDSTLGRIASHLRNLETLDIGGCSNITCNGILLIACGLKKLRNLNLRSLRHLSDEGIAYLAGISDNISVQGMSQLERLSLHDCQKLTDIALKNISIGMKNLKSLNLSFCTNITDTGVGFLAKMPTLQELNLMMCGNVGDPGIGHLAAGNSRLISLDVSFCERITDQSLVHISQDFSFEIIEPWCMSSNRRRTLESGTDDVLSEITSHWTVLQGNGQWVEANRWTSKKSGIARLVRLHENHANWTRLFEKIHKIVENKSKHKSLCIKCWKACK